jgi:caffeoyl-CoA O-methyltransferase
MSTSIALSPPVVSYLADANPPEHPVLARCRAETAALGGISMMQISAEQGAFMQIIARLTAARRAFEVGVFTGYSALAVALAMQERHGRDAHLLACDISEEWTSKGRGYWKEAGVEHIVDLHVAPALETLDHAIASGEAGTYDLGFIDADKTGYDAYYERGLTLLRTGGVMLFDNVLWSGKVADPAQNDPDTVTLRALAHKAKSDPRVHVAMTSIGDGILMCLKK